MGGAIGGEDISECFLHGRAQENSSGGRRSGSLSSPQYHRVCGSVRSSRPTAQHTPRDGPLGTIYAPTVPTQLRCQPSDEMSLVSAWFDQVRPLHLSHEVSNCRCCEIPSWVVYQA